MSPEILSADGTCRVHGEPVQDALLMECVVAEELDGVLLVLLDRLFG
jgi:hypothetical protein